MTYAEAMDASGYTTAQKLKLIYRIMVDGDDESDRYDMIADAQADGQAVIDDPSDTDFLIELAAEIWDSSKDHPRCDVGTLDATGDLAPLVAQLKEEGMWEDMPAGWSHR
jgi:hypothetical protein